MFSTKYFGVLFFTKLVGLQDFYSWLCCKKGFKAKETTYGIVKKLYSSICATYMPLSIFCDGGPPYCTLNVIANLTDFIFPIFSLHLNDQHDT